MCVRARIRAVVQVRGYGFCNHSSWLVVFGDDLDKDGCAGTEAEAEEEEEEDSETDSEDDSRDGMQAFIQGGAPKRRIRYTQTHT